MFYNTSEWIYFRAFGKRDSLPHTGERFAALIRGPALSRYPFISLRDLQDYVSLFRYNSWWIIGSSTMIAPWDFLLLPQQWLFNLCDSKEAKEPRSKIVQRSILL